mmetsp:Transcript_88575/g.251095  ORF Transcript_88575/g.251095 Transcript_88575/m.251095 type:complete len:239 (+) Transcript_88575:235-951(+)
MLPCGRSVDIIFVAPLWAQQVPATTWGRVVDPDVIEGGLRRGAREMLTAKDSQRVPPAPLDPFNAWHVARGGCRTLVGAVEGPTVCGQGETPDVIEHRCCFPVGCCAAPEHVDITRYSCSAVVVAGVWPGPLDRGLGPGVLRKVVEPEVVEVRVLAAHLQHTAAEDCEQAPAVRGRDHRARGAPEAAAGEGRAPRPGPRGRVLVQGSQRQEPHVCPAPKPKALDVPLGLAFPTKYQQG